MIAFTHLSRVMRKPAFCICGNKGADQLCVNRTAGQRFSFYYIYSAISLLPKSEILSLEPSSVTAQPGFCRTWSDIPKTGFLVTRLAFIQCNISHCDSNGCKHDYFQMKMCDIFSYFCSKLKIHHVKKIVYTRAKLIHSIL